MQTPFISPSRGPLTFDAMCAEILDYIREVPDAQYKLIIGTDSQVRQDTQFITAVVVHRLGKGARYFYQARKQRKIASLRQKIFYEASLSLSLATRLAERLAARGGRLPNVEIHLDVGTQGDTRDLIREVVGMVVGSGFHAKIKPESYAASSVADRHSK
ncbi:MAG: hypothetical protein DIU69_02115 [Bacillota bacterium]|nr:MAG: hypothetical protein DIU69_02115 [Bacillota bacterium]